MELENEGISHNNNILVLHMDGHRGLEKHERLRCGGGSYRHF